VCVHWAPPFHQSLKVYLIKRMWFSPLDSLILSSWISASFQSIFHPFFSQQINLYNFPFNSILGILLISMYFFSLLSMIFSQIPPFFYVISSPFLTLKWQVVVKPFVGLKVVFLKLSHWEFFPIFLPLIC
jgi:hypothetical protein